MCDNAVRSTLFGSFGILKRYSLLHNYLYRLHQAISTKSTAVLSQDGSLNPAFHLPDPMHTGWAEFQFRPYTAMTHTVCVTLALYKFYFPSCFTLLPFSPKWFTLYWKGLPHSGNIFPASPSPTPRHRFCPASSSYWNPHRTLWRPRSFASIFRMLWGNYRLCRMIICVLMWSIH